MTAIHQFVPVLEPGAVGAHTLEVQQLLRGLGRPSEIFACVNLTFAGSHSRASVSIIGPPG